MLMRNERKTLGSVLLFVFGVFAAGCSHTPYFSVIDADTGVSTRIEQSAQESTGSVVWASASPSDSHFFVMSTGQESGLTIRTIGVDGHVLDTKTVPVPRGIMLRFLVALSHDGRWMAYFDDQRHSFIKVDTATGSEVSAIPCKQYVSLLAWQKDGETLAAVASNDTGPGYKDFVALANFATGSVERVSEEGRFNSDECEVSPDGRYIALQPHGDGRLRVIDLVARSSFYDTPAGSIVVEFCWSADGAKLAYVDIGSSPPEVAVLSIPEAAKKTVLDPSKLGGLPNGLAFLDNARLIYGQGDSIEGNGCALKVFDLQSGKITKDFNVPFGGSIRVAANGKKIICRLR